MAFALAQFLTGATGAEDFVAERRLMVEEIESTAAPLAAETGVAS